MGLNVKIEKSRTQVKIITAVFLVYIPPIGSIGIDIIF